ncbi:MAG: acetyl-CoA C-acyltransferase [Myxococcota bacterium]
MTRVAVVAGCRTPFVKAQTSLRHRSAVELGRHAVEGLLTKAGVDPGAVAELHFGWVVTDPTVPHMAREVAFSSSLPASTRAITYSDNCITGTTAIIAAHDAIALGRQEIAIAGGTESMSNAAVLVSDRLSDALRESAREKSAWAKLKHLRGVRLRDLAPQLPGVKEPSTGLSMGEHTELMVKEWKIGREAQDHVALRSHQNAAAATDDGRLVAEIHPFDDVNGDGLIRRDTSFEKLAKLKPVFDRSEQGTLTAGNSSPLTDGASAVLLMSEERAKAEGKTPLAFLKGFENVAIDPADGLLMGPGIAVPRLLRRLGLTLDDMDLVEMHEAFGGQVLCNLAAWERGWKEDAIGTVPVEKLNVLGSSIAVGHPFAATGGRIVTTLARELARRDARYGLVSICAAGAQACAMVLERA